MTDDTKKTPRKRAPRKRSKTPTRKPDAAKRAEGQVAVDAPPANAAATQSNAKTRAEPASPPAPRVVATIPTHVRWHDLDAFNHVNNASFLVLLEEARLQWLRQVPGEWFGEHAMPVMAAIQLQYLQPLTWPAEIDVLLTCKRLGGTSVTLGNSVVERSEHARVYADGDIVMVWIDPATGKSVPLPDAIRKACAA